MSWQETHADKLMTTAEAAQLIQAGDTIWSSIGGDAASMMPPALARVIELGMDVKIVACSPTAAQEWFFDDYASMGFDLAAQIYAGPSARIALAGHRADWYPNLFSNSFNVWDHRQDQLPRMDVFMTSVTPPDADGYVTFGGQPWQKGEFARRARTTIMEVLPWYPNVPTTERLHLSEITALVETELTEDPTIARLAAFPGPTPEIEPVAGWVRDIVQDGDTIQIGAGRTTNSLAVVGAFEGKRDLGWHSEITPRGIIGLMMDGTINSSRKTYDVGLHVATTINARTPEEFDWLDNDPPVETRAVTSVNHILNIGRHERMTAINNAFQVDLTAQVAAESRGDRIYNGTGGQPEFHIGAAIAPGGKAITVLPSTAAGGTISRIVAHISDGSYITVPRHFADHVVTEFGIARLGGKSERQRAEELIAIAHPDFQSELRHAARRTFYPPVPDDDAIDDEVSGG
jgi:4-hydroxybutyrate CoA-transferase